jgi:hypothetical protein
VRVSPCDEVTRVSREHKNWQSVCVLTETKITTSGNCVETVDLVHAADVKPLRRPAKKPDYMEGAVPRVMGTSVDV